ncbi:DNA primase [Limnochorda pilosa]|uniref:DNA primase n=1 Tax=Limnochorda pilosa TaxID=1555112 RepID=A0A0K2SMH6_LIMPI|nr:DNA primase [Limnochorda pilosa]
MPWNQEAVEEIRRRADIVEVIADHVELRRQGRNLIGLCPFHQERTPSFSVSSEGQFFHCFGCGAGGDVFRFLMMREGIDFPEAVRRLARRVGVPEEDLAPSADARRRAAERARLVALNDLALRYFRVQLAGPAGNRARAYLERRGMASEVVERFGLGYAPGDGGLLRMLAEQPSSRRNSLLEDAHVLGLVLEGQRGPYERFRDRLIFPIRDASGQVIGFGGRLLGEAQGPKYLNSPESPLFHKGRILYALDVAGPVLRSAGRGQAPGPGPVGHPLTEAAPSTEALVVEGYMDAIALHQAGFTQAVASLGTSLTEDQAALLRRYADRAVIAYDGDAAGDRATLRGLEILARHGVSVRVATLPEGEDPDSLVRRGGPAAFRRVAEGALPLVEFLLVRILAGEEPTTVEGKARAVTRVLPVLARVENRVAREGYVERVANDIGVSASAVAAELERYLAGAQRTADVVPGPRGSHPGSRREAGGPRGAEGDPGPRVPGRNHSPIAHHTSRERPSKSPRLQRQAVSRWQRLEWELARRLERDHGLLPVLERTLGHPLFVGPGLADWATALQAAMEAGEPAARVLARMPVPEPPAGVLSPVAAALEVTELVEEMGRFRGLLELRTIERELAASDEDGVRALERLNGLLMRYHKVRARGARPGGARAGRQRA